MTWKWFILTASVKLILLVAPFLDVSDEFNLAGDTLAEAKEYAAVSSTMSMLFSTPILLALQTLNQTTQICRAGLDPLHATVFFIISAVALVAIYYAVPMHVWRGVIPRLFCFIGLIVAEWAFASWLVMPIAKWLCT